MFLEALSLVVSIVISLTWEDSLGSRPRFKMSCGWFLCVTRYRLPLLFLGSPSLEEGEGLAWRKGRGWPGGRGGAGLELLWLLRPRNILCILLTPPSPTAPDPDHCSKLPR